MSKIQEALKRADEHRNARIQSVGAIPRKGTAASARLDDEVRRFEASLAAWRAPRPAGPAATPQQPEPAASKNETNGLHAQTSPSALGRWDEEIRRCQVLVAACEERLTHSQQQRASLQAQAVEQERVVAQAAALLSALQQRFQECEAGVRSIEAERTAHGERLSALRQCQTLAQAIGKAEQQLHASTEAIARMARVQQRVAEKLSQRQQKSQELRAAAVQLRQQLAEARSRAQPAADATTNGGNRCHE